MRRVAGRDAFDKTLVQTEFAAVTDRDDNAGAAAVLVAIDGEALDEIVDFGAPLLEAFGFGCELVGEGVRVNFFELAQALRDLLDLGGEFGRYFRRLRAQAGVLRKSAIFEIEHRFGPRPIGTQFGGFGFKLFDRKPPRECGIVDKAFVVGIEEIARDRAAGGFISLGADKEAEIENRGQWRSRSGDVGSYAAKCTNAP